MEYWGNLVCTTFSSAAKKHCNKGTFGATNTQVYDRIMQFGSHKNNFKNFSLAHKRLLKVLGLFRKRMGGGEEMSKSTVKFAFSVFLCIGCLTKCLDI